ncbi:MAG: ParB/RepB/Spo0J family partition protein [Candidatus Zapsychrus exili]|nr:ParB/RepB/Spo0J family partition protein [Candidatus Zapsychrus exili]
MDKKALGKGLSALIPQKKEVEHDGDILYIATRRIEDSNFQPRTDYNDDKLNSLKESIKEKGILQPILVRRQNDGFEVIAGERRLKAARALSLEEIPAIVRDVTDKEALVIALIENIQREELNPIEEAESYKRLIDEFQYTQEQIAVSVGKDRSTVSNLLRLLNLSEEIKKAVVQGLLSAGHARTLLSIESDEERVLIYNIAVKKEMSVRELENLIKSKAQSGARRERQEKTKAQDILAVEESLQKLLGTKVRITPSKKRGKIVIDYYSTEDLDRIVRSMIQ